MMVSFVNSSMNLPATCRLPRSPLFGSASTVGPRQPRPRNSRSPTQSFRSMLSAVGDRESRVLQVLKLRGSGFTSGKHAYRVSSDGIIIFHVSPITLRATPTTSSRSGSPREYLSSTTCCLMATGVELRRSSRVHLDQERHSSRCTSSSTGADVGEQGIYATFQENPVQLERIVRGFSWSLEEPQDRTSVPSARRSLRR